MTRVVRDDLGVMPVVEFETIEEAIAEAHRQLGGDGVIAVHDADCEIESGEDATCTCVPLDLVLGGEA